MNALERVAWWNLFWVVLASVAVAASWPWLGLVALSFFGLMGFAGFSALFLRRPGFRAPLDERDHAIGRAALNASMRVVYVFFVFGFVWVMLTFGGGPTVPGKWINLMAWSGFALVIAVQSLVTLWHYRQDHRHAASS
ncbi:MAG TPA: hypothetical protein VHZ24_16980 [Pirellulales bacterium]|jgi:hypothetical protein|nr:hypothetical protein [Pirellulales bacterium]